MTTTGKDAHPASSLGPPAAPSLAWWCRDFPGDRSQVAEARHWIEDLLPACEALDDLLLFTSELCANSVVHTRSGHAGGRVLVTIEWTPASARVIVGDLGSTGIPSAAGCAEAVTLAD